MFCPAKDKANPKHKAIDMAPQAPLREAERENYAFFLDLPEPDRSRPRVLDVKGTQFLQPLFEYSGACAGCGETPYIKLLTQLFGDRLLIANATGCTSIYGGNLPTTPYTVNRDGRGPAWSNSLFEDNAEFGLGMRLALDSHREHGARAPRRVWRRLLPGDLVDELLTADQVDGGRHRRAARARRGAEGRCSRAGPTRRRGSSSSLADYLVQEERLDRRRRRLGLRHRLRRPRPRAGAPAATSTCSCSTPRSTRTPAASSPRPRRSAPPPSSPSAARRLPKKDLGLMAMSYGHVYVASIAFGAKDAQTVKALLEAEAYPGPSLIIAYSHCIAHGYDMAFGAEQQKLAVDSGVWPLYRFDPRRIAAGQPPLQLDSAAAEDPRRAVHEERDPLPHGRETRDPARRAAGGRRAARGRAALPLYQQLSGCSPPASRPRRNRPKP